ncbi:unnamed protein product, partial [Closterium sp. NIES-54]
TTHDKAVFSFNRDNRSCNGIAETLSRYRAIAPHVKLSGPTSFAPAIEAAVRIVEESGGNYHVLLIIADGQVTRSADVPPGQLSKQERATVDAIVAARDEWGGIGVGILAAPGPHEQKAVRFALSALMEVPLQFKACSEMGTLGKRIGRMPPTPPLPPPPRVLEMDAAAASGMGMGYQQQQQQQRPPYGQQQPPPYYQQQQQQPYPGAPLSSYPTAPSAPPAPDQFSSQEGGYPPPQGGYGQQSAYPPQQGGYSSQQGGYPPQPNQQGGYLPQQGGYSSQPGGYPAQLGNNPPQQGGYSSQPGSYPPQHAGSPTQQGGYSSQPGGYPPPPQQGVTWRYWKSVVNGSSSNRPPSCACMELSGGVRFTEMTVKTAEVNAQARPWGRCYALASRVLVRKECMHAGAHKAGAVRSGWRRTWLNMSTARCTASVYGGMAATPRGGRWTGGDGRGVGTGEKEGLRGEGMNAWQAKKRQTRGGADGWGGDRAKGWSRGGQGW